jgi:hypothetical protein
MDSICRDANSISNRVRTSGHKFQPVRFTTVTSALNPKGESKGLAAADRKGPVGKMCGAGWAPWTAYILSHTFQNLESLRRVCDERRESKANHRRVVDSG